MGRISNRLKNNSWFKSQLDEFRGDESNKGKRFELNNEDFLKCFGDNTPTTGFDRHYIYHTAWAVRYLIDNKIDEHTDISSTLYFSATASAFTKINFFDYRPAELELTNLSTQAGDLCDLKFEDDSIKSLSCMHTIEHVGLGRYGDPIDYDGDLKASKELSRVLAKGGNLLIVLPVGSKSLIQYNAHRIYTKNQVIEMFEGEGLKIKEFTLIPEHSKDGGLVPDPSDELLNKQKYACGCFIFTK